MNPAERELIGAMVDELGSSINRAGFESDCAIVDVGEFELVATTDGFARDTHFPEQATPKQAGHLAAAGALSDLAAAGAKPIGVLVAYGLPAEVDEARARGFSRGVARVVDAVDAEVLGGDTKPRNELSITVTCLGRTKPGRALTREGAKPGDRLVVTGGLGGAGAALDRLREGAGSEEAGPLMEPTPRIEAGRVLAEHEARCAMDLSDGLAEAARAIGEASGVQLVVEAERVPLHPWARESERGLEHALTTGGDYEVLASVPEQALATLVDELAGLDVDAGVVGRVEAGSGALLVDEGQRRVLEGGFEHGFGGAGRQD